jgi:hypothetical protein
MNEIEWSKQEKEIARHAYRTTYERECMSIALNTRKMVERINEPSDLWKIHDFLTKKREETDQKYDYRYSILLTLFARLVSEGWIKEEDLLGLSGDKLQEIHRIAEFFFQR